MFPKYIPSEETQYPGLALHQHLSCWDTSECRVQMPSSFDLQSSCIFVPKGQKDYKKGKICFHWSLSETLRYIPSCYFLLLTFL